MEIDCGTCLLRPLVPGDAVSLAEHANDRGVWLNVRDRFPHPYSLADAEAWIASSSVNTPQTSFGVIVAGQAVGGISLTPGQDIERVSAEIGYWLGRPFWGRGIMVDAVRAATRYAFEELGISRVFGVTFIHNIASCRVLEKAGYVLEGVMKQSAIKDGVILDQHLYAAYASASEVTA